MKTILAYVAIAPLIILFFITFLMIAIKDPATTLTIVGLSGTVLAFVWGVYVLTED
jgi:hypothetical protein